MFSGMSQLLSSFPVERFPEVDLVKAGMHLPRSGLALFPSKITKSEVFKFDPPLPDLRKAV